MVKTSSGFNNGQFDYMDVDFDATVDGNLIVGGVITGTIAGAISTTAGHFVATDANDQYRADSSTFDFISTTSLNPVFRFKGSDETTTNVTIASGFANFTALTGESVLIQSTDNVGSVVGPGSIRTLGGMCVTKNLVTGGNLVVQGSITAASTNISGAFSSGFFVATNTSGVNLTCNSTDDATGVSGVGSISTLGGVYIGRKAYVTTDLNVGAAANIGTTLNVVGPTTTNDKFTFTKTNTISPNGTSAFNVITNEPNSTNYCTTLQNNGTSVVSMLGIFAPNITGVNSIIVAIGKQHGVSTAFQLRFFNATNIFSMGHIGAALSVDFLPVTLQVNFKSTVASTTTTTGGVTFAGGIGVAGNGNFGGNVVVTGSLTASSIIGPVGGTAAAFTATNATGVNLTCTSTDAATSTPGVGSIYTPGGINAQKNIYIGTTAQIVGTTTCAAITSSGVITANAASGTTLAISSTTDASALGTGSAILLGGVSVAKNGYFGGNVVVTGSLTASSIVGPVGGTAASFTATNTSGTNYFANSTTNATSISTGSFQTLGGIGCLKDVWIGGLINIATTATVSGTATLGNISCSGSTNLATLTTTSTTDFQAGAIATTLSLYTLTGTTLLVQSTQAAISTITGCATFAGGIGVVGNVYVGNTVFATNVNVTSTPGTTLIVQSNSNSSNFTNGCATFAGGISMGGNAFVGGGILTAGVVTLTNTTPQNVLFVQNTAITVSPSTGSVVFAGGLGVGGDIQCGGVLYEQNLRLYSTGFWTPTLAQRGGTGGVSIVYQTHIGRWTRVGNLVCVYFLVYFNYGSNNVNTLVIDNVPFWPSYNDGACCMMDNATELGGLPKNYLARLAWDTKDILFQNAAGTNWALIVTGATFQLVKGFMTYITDDTSPRS